MIFYGLKTCDTCRKARKALEAADIDYTYRDVREDGISKAQVTKWAKAVGWEKLLNKASTTWRGLDETDKADLTLAKAVSLLVDHPTLIKRPVLEKDADVLLGWKKDTQAALGLSDA